MSDSLQPHGLEPARLLCPWDFPGKSTGVGCRLLQGIFLTQGSNPGLLHCRQTLYHLSHQGNLYIWASLAAQRMRHSACRGRRPGLSPCFGKIPWRRKRRIDVIPNLPVHLAPLSPTWCPYICSKEQPFLDHSNPELGAAFAPHPPASELHQPRSDEPILVSLLQLHCLLWLLITLCLIKQGRISAQGWQSLSLEKQPSMGSMDPLGVSKCVGQFGHDDLRGGSTTNIQRP